MKHITGTCFAIALALGGATSALAAPTTGDDTARPVAAAASASVETYHSDVTPVTARKDDTYYPARLYGYEETTYPQDASGLQDISPAGGTMEEFVPNDYYEEPIF